METANLYLYFNLLIEKLFGVSYWSMKLFSVIPGVIACGAVFLIGQLLFSRRIALLTTLLFTFAHWPVRLSRYGWDASFMIMAFSLAIWLLLLAMQHGRPLYAYASGLTAGLCLYSYLASRVCLLSLLFFLALECAMTHRRSFKHGIAFATGAAMAVYPLLCYYLFEPRAWWVRTAELNVFNSQSPLLAILDNIWRHAFMFFVIGGAYARDNFPGLPMMDPLTGLLFVVGLVILFGAVNTSSARLIACTLVLNFATGVFSVSQEGAPYVYRTAAVMIPAFLIAGIGAQFLIDKAESKFAERRLSKYFGAVTWPVFMLIIGLNLYFYFGLEPHNTAAMRIMAYEPRLIGLEIAQDQLPVILVGREILDPSNVDPRPGEKYANANPALILPPAARKLAVINFSGRYDPSQTVSSNFTNPKDIYFVERAMVATNNLTPRGPAKIIFRSSDRQLADLIQRNYPAAAIKQIRNIYQEPLLSVATLHRENTLESSPVTDAPTVK
ncbi:MAG TPA: glycosyltransferase family 39 protein [Candidatus Binatia bacterium]|nr:glycosyltransferase family 39 protein [Candidatus Binatia bacterium]